MGRNVFLDRTFNTSPTRSVPSQFSLGVGTTAPTVLDTAMEDPVPVQTSETVDNCDTADFSDSADMTTSLNTTTFKEGVSSINLTKDGTGSATASCDKTEGGTVDFTSKDLTLWFYVDDSTVYAQLAVTSCVTIRFGSDNSNYYEWLVDKADLAVGWTYLQGFNSSNANSTTGSPSIAAMDYIYIAVTATASGETWAAGEIAMDTWDIVEASDYFKAFEVDYPSLDFTINEATIRTRVNTLQANGHQITEHGVFNSDATKLLFSRDTFTAIAKTDDDELIFEAKTLIQ